MGELFGGDSSMGLLETKNGLIEMRRWPHSASRITLKFIDKVQFFSLQIIGTVCFCPTRVVFRLIFKPFVILTGSSIHVHKYTCINLVLATLRGKERGPTKNRFVRIYKKSVFFRVHPSDLASWPDGTEISGAVSVPATGQSVVPLSSGASM